MLQDVRSAESAAEIVAHADPEQGIALQTAASGATASAEELCFDAAPIDPLRGWSHAQAAKRRPLGLICGPAAATLAAADLADALAASTDPDHVYFALLNAGPPGGGCCGGGGGCCGARDAVTAFALRPAPYTRVSDDEYARLLEPDAWPPAGDAAALACGAVRAGFVVDGLSFGCEQVRGEEFLYTSKAPRAGLALCLQLALPDAPPQPQQQGYTRMYGRVTRVGPLPPPNAPADEAVGVSYFASNPGGREYTRDELLGELGTLHGQRVEGVVYLAPEQVGVAPRALAGQWHVVLVADDRKQALWQLLEMTPLPRDQWIERIPR